MYRPCLQWGPCRSSRSAWLEQLPTRIKACNHSAVMRVGTMQSMNLSTIWHLYLDGGKFHFWFIWKSQLSRNVITSKKSIWKIHINISSIFVLCVLLCNYCKISKRSYLIRWRRCFRMRPPQTAEWISRILGARVPPRLIYDSLWITSYGSAWEKRKKEKTKIVLRAHVLQNIYLHASCMRMLDWPSRVLENIRVMYCRNTRLSRH